MKQGKRELIFIAGLPRVGSTLLDMVLGCNPGLAGVGELYEALRPEWRHLEGPERICSCGLSLHQCPYWSKLAKKIDYQKPIECNYEIAYDTLQKLYGNDIVMIDSSKAISYIMKIAQSKLFDIKIIYLIRDVRAWTISRIDRAKKSPDQYGWNGYYIQNLIKKFGWKMQLFRPVMPILTRSATYYFIIWYLQNKRNLTLLEKSGLPFSIVSYDEFALNPKRTLIEIGSFISRKDLSLPKDFSGSKSHILIGNSMGKKDPKRKAGIRYDNRWFYRNEWLLPATLLRKITNFNANHLYRTTRATTIFGNQ